MSLRYPLRSAVFAVVVLAPASGVARETGGLVVSSGFGARIDPLRHVIGTHRGVDLPGAPGTPILAAASGTVRIAGWRGGYGILVEIEHADGSRTRYGHLSRAAVTVGARVATGDPIGAMGATGRATGSHLHFEYLVAGRARDPLDYLTGAAAAPVPAAVRITPVSLHRSSYAIARVAPAPGDRLPDGRAAAARLAAVTVAGAAR